MQYSRDCITITSNNLFFHFQKHPHLRGENASVMSKKDAIWETSPPAWGKPPRPTLHLLRLGNIPTYVGKTRIPALSSRPFGKHPHLRGENQAKSIRAAKLMETSPPAWGKLTSTSGLRITYGNIPTCVGKTEEEDRRELRFGETSPPAWGKPRPFGRQSPSSGNIPTCVGKTVSVGIVAMTSRKHPHLRGENRARTTLDRSIVGNIPTCVGKTGRRTTEEC